MADQTLSIIRRLSCDRRGGGRNIGLRPTDVFRTAGLSLLSLRIPR